MIQSFKTSKKHPLLKYSLIQVYQTPLFLTAQLLPFSLYENKLIIFRMWTNFPLYVLGNGKGRLSLFSVINANTTTNNNNNERRLM